MRKGSLAAAFSTGNSSATTGWIFFKFGTCVQKFVIWLSGNH